MNFGPEEQKLYDSATICHICKKEFKEGDKVCRDHDHRSGKFRNKTHSACNLNYKTSWDLPVIAHNSNRYDNHYLIESIFHFPGKTSVISQTSETYLAVYKKVENSKIRFCFIDSFRFLNASLDSLVSLLDKDKDFNELEKFYDKKVLKLVKNKGFFPYEWFDDKEKLKQTSLPEKKHFYSSLTDSHITDENYQHALEIWNILEVKNFKNYMLFYNKLDVLLLSIVFEKLRDTFMEKYELDCSAYISLPALAFNSMLKLTGVEIELITDINIFLWVEKTQRGGMCEVIKRRAVANNKYLSDTYDPSKPDTYLTCFDVNSLYSTAMSSYLPIGGYEFIENFDLNTSPDEDFGYMLEVNLKYPIHLHKFFKDMPLFAEHRKPPGGKFEKLLRTLNDKKNYIVHLKPLQQAIKLGVQVEKIHKVLKFKQSKWLKPYIEKNNELRGSTNNEFEKNLWKLMNNSVFGKFMENLRKRKEIKLCGSWGGRGGAEAYISRPTFKRSVIFSENLVAIEMEKTKIIMNKPIIIGSAILDISKYIFNSFYYDFLLSHYSQKDCQVLYIDTDSYYLELKNKDIYDVMRKNPSFFDTSNFSENNQFNLPIVNKQKLGVMKCEYGENIMTDFVALSPKQYAIRFGRVEKKKCKGVKKSIIQKQIKFDDYVECLENLCTLSKTQMYIRSKLHRLYTIKENKVVLSSDYDKRKLKRNLINTLPFGYKKYRVTKKA